jgi:hypothetical protein
MRSHAPIGFHLLAICAMVFGTIMALLVLDPRNGGDPGERMWMRACAALLAVLSGVVMEALSQPRPWAYRATLALAYAVVVTLLCLRSEGLGLEVAFWILLFSSWVVVPSVMYVRGQSTRLFGTPQPPNPVPPSPVPPGGRQQPWW